MPDTLDVQITPRTARWICQKYGYEPENEFSDYVILSLLKRALTSGELDHDTFVSLQEEETTMATKATASNVLGGGSRVNLKDESSKYSTKRYEAKHRSLGQTFHPVTKKPLSLPSELDAVKSGCLFKHLAQKAGINVSFQEHERALFREMIECDDWCGKIGSTEHEKISGGPVKALFDEAGNSQGLELVPIWFDNDITTFPLLTSELLGRVDIKPVPRGRRLESASVSTPTASWGQGDLTTAPLFATAGMVQPLDSVIFGCSIFVEVGLDFLSDSAVSVGALLQRLLSERLGSELELVIATGNGTTQPVGLTNSAGIGSVNTDAGVGGGPTLNDYSTLMFDIAKQYRVPNMRCAFVSNDVTFMRSRQIRNDPSVATVDQRPVLTGGDTTSFNTYTTLGWPHLIQNSIPNGTCLFGALSKYRLYQRQGMDLRIETGGRTNVLTNTALVHLRARYGGRIMDQNSWSAWVDGQA